ALDGNPEEATMSFIIRDHDRDKFEARKAQITHNQEELNQRFDQERIKVEMYDQYYNMKENIEKDMSNVELAKQAMIELGISP
ncbi:peptidase T, partial [Enterococcus faecium]